MVLGVAVESARQADRAHQAERLRFELPVLRLLGDFKAALGDGECVIQFTEVEQHVADTEEPATFLLDFARPPCLLHGVHQRLDGVVAPVERSVDQAEDAEYLLVNRGILEAIGQRLRLLQRHERSIRVSLRQEDFGRVETRTNRGRAISQAQLQFGKLLEMVGGVQGSARTSARRVARPVKLRLSRVMSDIERARSSAVIR